MAHEEDAPKLTWNQYLDDVIRHLSAAEKQHVYLAVGLSRTSFQRWRNGENLPEAAHIPPLLGALAPEPRARLLELMLDDPRTRALLPDELVNPKVPSLADGIASSFYAEMFRLQRETTDRFWVLSEAILQHALAALDRVVQPIGLHILLVRCMPAHANGNVRSLRSQMAIGTRPWRTDLHREERFFGAESLVGQAVMSRRRIMIPELQATSEVGARSMVATPIQREGALAGALLVRSAESDFFTPERLTRIEHYADLIRLAFSDADFIPASRLALALLPADEVQSSRLATVSQRIQETYRRALAQEHDVQDLAQIEQQVWQEIETELIQEAVHAPVGASEYAIMASREAI